MVVPGGGVVYFDRSPVGRNRSKYNTPPPFYDASDESACVEASE